MKKIEFKMKENKAITLIALVVTIVILIILAGLLINLTIGDSGLFNKAKMGAENYKEQQVNEKVQTMLADYITEKHTIGKELTAYLDEQITKGTIESYEDNEDGTITILVDDYEVVVNTENLKIESVEKYEEPQGLYSIKYVANGGKGRMRATAGDNPVVAENSFIPGFNKKFLKWNTSEDGTGDNYTAGTAVTQNLKLYAIWEDVIGIGTEISYSPSGRYDWRAQDVASFYGRLPEGEHYTEYNSNDHYGLLDSGDSESGFQINTWKVISVNETTKEVKLIASTPTENTVKIMYDNGYYNGVNILNDACETLYSATKTKNGQNYNITARSIKVEDVDEILTKTGKDYVRKRSGWVFNETTGEYEPEQKREYGSGKNTYPYLYPYEKLSVIDNSEPRSDGLGQSDEVEELNTYGWPYSNAEISITPFNTSYSINETKNNFKQYVPEENLNLLLCGPNYWIASRCIKCDNDKCNYGILFITSTSTRGAMDCGTLSTSQGGGTFGDYSLLPVVTLNYDLIEDDGEGGYRI